MNSTKTKYITCEQQKQILGGGAGPHNYVAPSKEKQEELWEGYANEDYDIKVTSRHNSSLGTFINFTGNASDRGASTAGVIKV